MKRKAFNEDAAPLCSFLDINLLVFFSHLKLSRTRESFRRWPTSICGACLKNTKVFVHKIFPCLNNNTRRQKVLGYQLYTEAYLGNSFLYFFQIEKFLELSILILELPLLHVILELSIFNLGIPTLIVELLTLILENTAILLLAHSFFSPFTLTTHNFFCTFLMGLNVKKTCICSCSLIYRERKGLRIYIL